MERRRTRLEILAQVAAHNYGLSLRYGDKPGQEEEAIQIEDPERTLAQLGGDLGDESVLRYQKGMVLLEVAHRLEGSLRWAVRAARAERERPGFFHVWHTLEDARCERRLAASLPGTPKNFRAFVRPALERAAGDHARGDLPVFFQIQWGLYLLGTGPKPGAAAGDESLRADWFDPPVTALLQRLAPAVERACASAGGAGCLEAAGEIYEALRRVLTEEQLARAKEALPLPDIPEEALLKDDSREGEGADGEESALLPEIAGDQDGPPEAEPVELTPEELAALGHWASPRFELKGRSKEVHPTALLPDERTIVIPPEGRLDEYQAIVENAGSHIKVLAWKLMQIIQERTYTRYSGSHRSGKLNAPKLWKQRLGKYRLFQRRESPERLDICFTLLVDESGSMNRESKYLAAREATVFFAEVLDRLDVPFEIIGYSTENSEAAMAAALGHVPAFKFRHIRHSPLQHRIYKAFEEPFAPIKARLVNIYPRFNNWDEEHLTFAYRRLIAREEREK
ncbi:MAG: hypothetical protein V3V62_13465, partial [bacterium]